MAEISKITLPNGDTYDIKDPVARNHGNARIFSADCSTAAATQRKDVTITECTELIAGDVFVITFINYQNYNGTPTIQINSLGAKNIRRITGTNAGRYEWANGETIIFVWNGTYFLILNGGFATTTVYGRTKLYTGSGSASAALALTPASLYYMANRSICPYYSTSATYAVGDKVRYGDYIYECITAITTAEAWTAAHWEIAPTLQEQITAQSGLAYVENEDTIAANANYTEGKFICWKGNIFRVKATVNITVTSGNWTTYLDKMDGMGGALSQINDELTALKSKTTTVDIKSLVTLGSNVMSNSRIIKMGNVVYASLNLSSVDNGDVLVSNLGEYKPIYACMGALYKTSDGKLLNGSAWAEESTGKITYYGDSATNVHCSVALTYLCY